MMRAFVAAGRASAVGACFVPYALTCRLWDCCRSGVPVAVTLAYPEHMPVFFQFLVFRGCPWTCFWDFGHGYGFLWSVVRHGFLVVYQLSSQWHQLVPVFGVIVCSYVHQVPVIWEASDYDSPQCSFLRAFGHVDHDYVVLVEVPGAQCAVPVCLTALMLWLGGFAIFFLFDDGIGLYGGAGLFVLSAGLSFLLLFGGQNLVSSITKYTLKISLARSARNLLMGKYF